MSNSRKSNSNSRGFVKHSGAKFIDSAKTKNKVPAISAWNASKERGMIKLIASPNRKSHTHVKGDNERGLWTAKVTFLRTGTTQVLSAIYHISGKKAGNLYIPDMGMVVNPSAPNGGYFGTANFKD